ncbi:hypothetical protein Tco_0256891 [Tanacetum coccineum]
MGLGLSVFDRERGYKGRVRWEEVRGELERYLGEWYWLENVGKGCMVFGAKWVGLQGCSFGLKEKNGKDATLVYGWSLCVHKQIEKESSSTIKLEDLANLVSHVQLSFKDMDSPEDDLVIVVDDSDEDEDDEVHATKNVETEDTLVPKSSSPKSSQIQELTNQVLILQSQKYKLKLEKNKAEAEVALLKAQPFFPNWVLLAEFFPLPALVETIQAKLKTLDALPSHLLNVTQALNKFAQVLNSTSSKAGDQSVPSAGQADTMPAEGEKNTNQATISQLF